MSPVNGSVYFVAIQSDVTEWKEMQLESDLLKRALNAADEAVLICDMLQPEEPIIYCNTGFEKMTGYKKEEALGKNCRFLQGKDTNKETVKKIRKYIQQKESYSVEILNYKKGFKKALILNSQKKKKRWNTFLESIQFNTSSK